MTSEQKGRDDFLNYFISSFPVKLLYFYTIRSFNYFMCQITVYFGSNFNVIALMATITVESDIKTAPTAGLNVMPIGASIPAAIGIAIKLYPAPQTRFSFILRVVF